MSVIKPPRIYFKGHIEWDPNTSNNNKWVHEWNIDKAELNWDYLSRHGISRDNYLQKFPIWASELLPIGGDYGCQSVEGDQAGCGTAAGPKQPTMNKNNQEQPALWNYFGGNSCDFVNNNRKKTTIHSGVDFDGNTVTDDAIIGAEINLLGNPFGGHPTPARLIDVDAASTLTTQILFDSIELRKGNALWLHGKPGTPMQSRLINFKRNVTYNHVEAGGAACSWQFAIPIENIRDLAHSDPDYRESNLLRQLVDMASVEGGLMIRFCTYLTLYFQNGIYNDIKQQPRSAGDIVNFYKRALSGEIPYFSNPAYSRVVGSIGVWNSGLESMMQNDMQSSPSDRTLYGTSAINYRLPLNENTNTFASGDRETHPENTGKTEDDSKLLEVKLGPTLIGFSFDWQGQAKTVHLDLSNSIPERSNLPDPEVTEKLNLGSFEIGVLYEKTFHRLATIDYQHYRESVYEKSSGMVDLKAQPVAKSAVEKGDLQLRPVDSAMEKQAEPVATPVATEQIVIIQGENRAVYLDQGERNIQVHVSMRTRGLPVANQQLIVARYLNTAITAECEHIVPISVIRKDVDDSHLSFSNNHDVIDVGIKGGGYAEVLLVNCDDVGDAWFGIDAQAPGIVYMMYFDAKEFLDDSGNLLPQSIHAGNLLTGNYSVARIMPFDDGIQHRFVECWNQGWHDGETSYDRHSPDAVWAFIQQEILGFYAVMYPVMARYVPLDNRARMEGSVDQLKVTLSEAYMRDQSTMMMPITRDLSSAKRWVLLRWCDLVSSRYQPINLPPYS